MDTGIKSVYETEIFRLAEKHESKVFYNSSAEHASIVHLALASYAKEYIDIFSSSMCTEVSNNQSIVLRSMISLMRIKGVI